MIFRRQKKYICRQFETAGDNSHGCGHRQLLQAGPFYLLPISFRRDGGIRTHGLSVPNAALYQAEPHPDTTDANTLKHKTVVILNDSS